jgi:hypothetical protein
MSNTRPRCFVGGVGMNARRTRTSLWVGLVVAAALSGIAACSGGDDPEAGGVNTADGAVSAPPADPAVPDEGVLTSPQIPATNGQPSNAADASCLLTVEKAEEIFSEPMEDEGWSPPKCAFSPVAVPGYGDPNYAAGGTDLCG